MLVSVAHFRLQLLLELCVCLLGDRHHALLEVCLGGVDLGTLGCDRLLQLQSGLERLVGLSLLGAPLDLGLLLQQVQHSAL